ncbi:acyl carrier protein [Streptomyces sp. NPDC005406]|uniref:acyl carrier protein n=1 Tax=Streptomyces sp. NPDC005406 TaxID=3155339 RepID=UPI003455C960
MIADLLGLDGPFPADQPLGEMGIDSLTAAQLSVEVEEHTGAYVPLEHFLGEDTVEGLVRAMEREATATPVPGAVAGASA